MIFYIFLFEESCLNQTVGTKKRPQTSRKLKEGWPLSSFIYEDECHKSLSQSNLGSHVHTMSNSGSLSLASHEHRRTMSIYSNIFSTKSASFWETFECPVCCPSSSLKHAHVLWQLTPHSILRKGSPSPFMKCCVHLSKPTSIENHYRSTFHSISVLCFLYLFS